MKATVYLSVLVMSARCPLMLGLTFGAKAHSDRQSRVFRLAREMEIAEAAREERRQRKNEEDGRGQPKIDIFKVKWKHNGKRQIVTLSRTTD